MIERSPSSERASWPKRVTETLGAFATGMIEASAGIPFHATSQEAKSLAEKLGTDVIVLRIGRQPVDRDMMAKAAVNTARALKKRPPAER